MKMSLKMKKRWHRCELNQTRSISNTQATSEAEFIKKLNNTEAELKKSVADKKACTTRDVFRTQ